MLIARVQGCDLVFVDGQGAVVSGVCFSLHQCPGLVQGARGEDRVREGDEAYAGGRGGGGEAQQTSGGDEERGGRAGEGVGARIAFGGVDSGGVGADPGDAVEGGAADLPARGVEFETDGAAEFVEGEVDRAQVIAGGGGEPGDVAPAGRAGGALEVFVREGGVIVRIVERIAAAGHGGPGS